MATTYFTPEENMLYSISFQDEGWWGTYGTSNNILGKQIADPTTQPFPNNEIEDAYLWQFFKVAENTYALANYKYGNLGKLVTSNGYVNLGAGELQKETPVFTLINRLKQGSDADWVQLYASTVDIEGIVHAQPSLPGYLRVEAVTDFSFSIKKEKMNPAAENLVAINTGEEINEPVFINGTAPQTYPVTPMLMNELYVPYFMVKDKTLPNMADRIQQTPYYILRQYGQFEMVAEYKNNSVGTVTFVEHWEYGWSATVSGNISAELGFELGGDIEENEIFLKEEEEVTIKLTLGIDLGASVSGSGSYSKEIRAEAPPATSIAIYGTSATFELYQGNGVTAVAKPNVPMKMNKRYVSISDPTPEV